MKTRFAAMMLTCALFHLPGAFAASRTAKCKEQHVMNPLLCTTSGSSSLCLLDAVTCVAGTRDESNDWLGYTTSPLRGDTINVGAGQIVLDFSRCTTNPYTNPTVNTLPDPNVAYEVYVSTSPIDSLAQAQAAAFESFPAYPAYCASGGCIQLFDDVLIYQSMDMPGGLVSGQTYYFLPVCYLTSQGIQGPRIEFHSIRLVAQ